MIYGIIIVPIAIAYYYDYKSDPKEFDFSIKTIGKGISKGLLYLVLLAGANAIYKSVVPINKNHGIEFNSEREKLGLPKLEKNWTISDWESEQFVTYWWKPEPKNGHFKKILEYGFLGLKTETDYYHNEKQKGTFAWSKYDFGNNTFEYFLEKPNDQTISVTKNGNLKFEKPTQILNIKKAEFEKYISE
ncbi:hypothetical protein [Aquimarina megaterium]|uniref:hypothetical protein n=1 Tax=Aquimarina megaterium TaxID=1443666 RepID=UPI00046F2BCC|nr:hypothetical protein [Aquimarina megaterium]